MKEKRKKIKISYKKRRQNHRKTPPLFYEKNLKPRCTISFTTNNIFMNISLQLFNFPNLYSTLFWCSCGSRKFSKQQFKGSAKTTYIANFSFGRFTAQKLCFLNFNNKILNLYIKGGERFLKSFWNGFKTIYNGYLCLFDSTPISFNGCRKRKKRRI